MPLLEIAVLDANEVERTVATNDAVIAAIEALAEAMATPTTPAGVAMVTVLTSARTLAQLLQSAGALGGIVPADATLVWIQPRGGDIRFADAGYTPTVDATGLGIDIYDRVAWPYSGSLAEIKLIASASSAVPCTLMFYG